MINSESGKHLKNAMSEMALAVNQSIGKEWHLLYGIYELTKEVYENYIEKETQCNIAQDIESCEECGFCEKPQVQPTFSKTEIVRTPEEIAKMLNRFRKNDVNCIDCEAFEICENLATDEYTCEDALIAWLKKKEV